MKQFYNTCCSSNGRIKGTLADCVSLALNGDYGADHAARSSELLDQCAEKGVFVQIIPLKTIVQMELAMGTSTSAESRTVGSNRKAHISITLQTLAGPLSLRNVE